jgi:hypothetical protein
MSAHGDGVEVFKHARHCAVLLAEARLQFILHHHLWHQRHALCRNAVPGYGLDWGMRFSSGLGTLLFDGCIRFDAIGGGEINRCGKWPENGPAGE